MTAPSTVRAMNHDPGNDLCASSPFEGCICHLSGAEQLALRSSAAAVAHPSQRHRLSGRGRRRARGARRLIALACPVETGTTKSISVVLPAKSAARSLVVVSDFSTPLLDVNEPQRHVPLQMNPAAQIP